MCPRCWGMLPLCDECLSNSAHPERLLWPTYTMQAQPGGYTIVTANCSMIWESSVTLST